MTHLERAIRLTLVAVAVILAIIGYVVINKPSPTTTTSVTLWHKDGTRDTIENALLVHRGDSKYDITFTVSLDTLHSITTR